MDPEVSVLLHCAGWRGLLESQVQVELSERFNRQTDPALEQQIDKVWTRRVTKEPWLFNGAKFRLHSFTLTSPPSLLSSSSFNPASSLRHKRPQLPQTPREDGSGDADGGNRRDRREERCLRDAEGGAATPPTRDARRSSNCGSGGDEMNQSGHGDGSLCCGVKDAALAEARDAQTSFPTENHGVVGEPAVCRVSEAQEQPSPGGDQRGGGEAPVLTLRLGLTCYKDFLGTNWSRGARELRRRGEAEFRDPLALLAQPLGVGGVLRTRDGQVVLIRRSQRVAEAGGLLDVPGGHPEPKAACEGVCVPDDQITMAVLQTRERAVVQELFSSVCAEIRDEVNVPLCSLGEPVLLGVALNHTSSGRPSAEFYIRCSMSSAEVRELYWRGGAEAHESTDIVFLSPAELLQLDKSAPLWSELCPSAKGAVILYQLVLADKDDGTEQTQSSQVLR